MSLVSGCNTFESKVSNRMNAGGYMVQAAVSAKYAFDLQPGDVYWCTADCGVPQKLFPRDEIQLNNPQRQGDVNIERILDLQKLPTYVILFILEGCLA